MTDWKTIKVPPEDKERADDYRPEDSTWGDCLVAGAERLNEALDSKPPATSNEFSHRIEEPNIDLGGPVVSKEAWIDLVESVDGRIVGTIDIKGTTNGVIVAEQTD